MVARRNDLVAAVVASAQTPCRANARRFVSGLSADELQFIAEFLGASILDSARRCCCSRAEWAERVSEFQRKSRSCCCDADQDHKMILLLEFLCRSGARQAAPQAGAGAFY